MIKTAIHLVAVACAVFVGSAFAAAAAPQEKAKAAASLRPTPKTKKEADDFNAILCRVPLDSKNNCPANGRNDPETILGLTVNFMALYPASPLAAEISFLRFDAYVTAKKFDPAIDELQKGVEAQKKYLNDKTKAETDKNSPALQDLQAYNNSQELLKYQQLMEAASAANQMKLAAAAGDFILERIPNHYPTLLLVARTAAQSVPNGTTKEAKAAKAEQLDHAEEAGQMAINAVMTFLEGPQSTEYTQQQRDDLAYRAHSIIGFIYIQKERYGDAQKAYQMALTLKKDDPVAYYYLGLSYYADMPTKTDAAIDALQRSAAQKGSSNAEKGSRELLTRIYVETNRPLADIDKDIQAASLKLGK